MADSHLFAAARLQAAGCGGAWMWQGGSEANRRADMGPWVSWWGRGPSVQPPRPSST